MAGILLIGVATYMLETDGMADAQTGGQTPVNRRRIRPFQCH